LPSHPDAWPVDPYADGAGPVVLMAPGATWSAKQWPAAHYAALARRLAADGLRVFILAGPAERDQGQGIAEQGGARLLPPTDARMMAEAIRRAAVLISTDSGARHVAVAVGTPSVGIYGPSDPAIWSVAEPRHPILRLELPCSPCGLTRCPLPGHPCMNALTPEMAHASIRDLMAREGLR
jgi:heptosyltransferase-2